MQDSLQGTTGVMFLLRRRFPLAAWYFVGAMLAGISGCDVGSDGSTQLKDSSKGVRDPGVLPVPPLPETKWLNTSADVEYIGSHRCKECHEDVHQAFQLTRHSRAFSNTDNSTEPNAVVRNELSGHEYTTRCTDDGRLIHTEAILMRDGTAEVTREVEIDYTVGSGRFGKSYLAKLDGFLVQSPLTWFQDREAWGLSPGYEHEVQYSFRRTVSARCLYCHTGTVEVEEQNEYFPAIQEQFVSCERCHGPGQLHEQKYREIALASSVSHGARSANGDVDRTIVNPSHLDRELQEAICQQCHLQTDAQVPVRGYRFDSFRPGLPLTAVRQDYHYGPISNDMTVVGHVDQLHQSRCYTESDTLTCATCHEPHSGDPQSESPMNHRLSCLKCHGVESCNETQEVRTRQQDHCTVCHMPSAPTEIPHVAFTHHRIAIHSPVAGQSGPQSFAESENTASGNVVEAVLGDGNLSAADQLRCRGLAALATYLKKEDAANRTTLQYAQQSLQEAWDLGARDVSVAASMAKIAYEVSWPERVESWAKIALALDQTPSEDRNSALTMLSELQFGRKEYEEAYQGFLELTQIRRDARMWFFRGACEQNLGKTADAVSSLRKSVEINPRNQAAHVALSALYKSQDDMKRSEVHRRWAENLVR